MKIELRDVSKSYGSLQVFDHISMQLESGNVYCLMGPSGSGKTTLLHILLGLEHADSGTISGISPYQLAAVFQENRLCEDFSPISNVMMVTGRTLSTREVYKEMSCLLPKESLTRPVSTLSGGMKRRVAILRALLAPADGIVMDEPFTGLDEDTKQMVIDYMKAKTARRLLLFSSHQEADVRLLGASLFHLYSDAVVSSGNILSPPRP